MFIKNEKLPLNYNQKDLKSLRNTFRGSDVDTE